LTGVVNIVSTGESNKPSTIMLPFFYTMPIERFLTAIFEPSSTEKMHSKRASQRPRIGFSILWVQNASLICHIRVTSRV
jgi:hypothetical protein